MHRQINQQDNKQKSLTLSPLFAYDLRTAWRAARATRSAGKESRRAAHPTSSHETAKNEKSCTDETDEAGRFRERPSAAEEISRLLHLDARYSPGIRRAGDQDASVVRALLSFFFRGMSFPLN